MGLTQTLSEAKFLLKIRNKVYVWNYIVLMKFTIKDGVISKIKPNYLYSHMEIKWVGKAGFL